VNPGKLVGQLLTSPNVEWHARPAVVVKQQLSSNKSFSTRFWVNPVSRTVCFSAVTSIVLTTNKVSRSFRWRVDTETPQCLDLFNPDIGVSKGNWLFHCQLGNDLHNVVLYHVTQGTRLVVVTGPLFD